MKQYDVSNVTETIEDLLSSQLNNKSVLFIHPGNNVSEFGFCGLNITHGNINHLNVYTDDGNNLSDYYDYIIIHGFLYRSATSNKNILQKFNLSCDVLVVDYLGEGYPLQQDLSVDNTFSLIKSNTVKILAPFEDYSELDKLYPNLSFFKYPFAGPKNFCSKYNTTIHLRYTGNANKALMGLKWRDDKRNKLFVCLNNAGHYHRLCMVQSLIDYNLLENGYVSNAGVLMDADSNFLHPSKRIQPPKIVLDGGNEGENRFTLQKWGWDSYIDVVTETNHGIMKFMTEKSMKPFYNLQLPIIFGYPGIIGDLRRFGFDVFDDIIDHSYDDMNVSSDINIKNEWSLINKHYNELAITKSKMIAEELVKLSKLDIHSIYLDLKERLIHNQNLLYKLTIEDNNLVEDYGKWIFGDNIIFNKNDYIEKIYI